MLAVSYRLLHLSKLNQLTVEGGEKAERETVKMCVFTSVQPYVVIPNAMEHKL